MIERKSEVAKKGEKLSEETKKKLSAAQRKRFQDPAEREKSRVAARRQFGDPYVRFWSCVDKSGGPDACWMWLQSVDRNGYGRTFWDGRCTQAHRIAWQIINGPIPKGIQILHTCDNSSCVNPTHLYAGSHRDNMNDMVRRSRLPRGIRHHRARLSEADVKEIRASAAGSSQSAIAKRFGITQSHVRKIVLRKLWQHVK